MKSDRINTIIDYVREYPWTSSGEIYDGLAALSSYATLKRDIAGLLSSGWLQSAGNGKAVKYSITDKCRLLYEVDIDKYFEKEVDDRVVFDTFNFGVFKMLSSSKLFSDAEEKNLENLQAGFKEKISKASPEIYRKEMERLAIDLSWKSSQIEGNTYSLLETERLLVDKKTASGKTKDEAVMLLNHKEALDFILANPDYLSPLTMGKIEDIHSILVKELDVERNIRNSGVGVGGSKYRPLDNVHQIREALEDTCELINARVNVFEKALLILLMVSYIQPFSDGNKRTARIVSNAELIANSYCPLSFRTVDSMEYKKAMLLFYEQNNISVFKRIFIAQFEFAVNTYF